MKKILAFFVAAACAVSAMATNYEGELTVAINEETTAMGTNITVDKTGAGYDLRKAAKAPTPTALPPSSSTKK